MPWRGNAQILLALLTTSVLAQCPNGHRAVLLISVDGLRPDHVIEADKHGLRIPNLRQLFSEGVHASVRGVLPTATYPSHATLVTGASPAKHGIPFNHPFNSMRQCGEVWYWFYEDLRVPTLWDVAAAAGYVTASVSWPVTAGASSIRYNIPEYARTRDEEDAKMIRALATPGLLSSLAPRAGPYLIEVSQPVARDWARTRYAVELIRNMRACFVTVHLAATDQAQHQAGPFSQAARAAIESVDEMIGILRAAIRDLDPQAVTCVVSDHGFAPVERVLRLDAAFVKAGLIRVKNQRETLQASEIVAWEAMPWSSGGSAAIILNEPRDAVVRKRVEALLRELASDPQNGIAEILDRPAIERAGSTGQAEFWVTMRSGFALSASLAAPPLVTRVSHRGAHGHSPTNEDMDALLLLAGPGLRKNLKLDRIDMRAIAPTLARIMKARLAGAEVPALEGIFE